MGDPHKSGGAARSIALIVLHRRPAQLAAVRLWRPAADALQMIGNEGVGVLVYLPQEGRGIGLIEKLKHTACKTRGSIPSKRIWALGFKRTRAITESGSNC